MNVHISNPLSNERMNPGAPRAWNCWRRKNRKQMVAPRTINNRRSPGGNVISKGVRERMLLKSMKGPSDWCWSKEWMDSWSKAFDSRSEPVKNSARRTPEHVRKPSEGWRKRKVKRGKNQKPRWKRNIQLVRFSIHFFKLLLLILRHFSVFHQTTLVGTGLSFWEEKNLVSPT